MYLLNWLSLACCQSIVSMTTVNKNRPVYTVNHQGGKTRQSHCLQFPALCYYIYNAFDSALCGAVKTNAILTTLFGVCVPPGCWWKHTSCWKNSFPVTCMYWSMHLLCVHIQYSYAEVSVLCVHRRGREATTVSRFDSKEICSKWAHPSAEACGDKGMMRRRRVRRKMKRDSGAEQGPSRDRDRSERSLAVKYDGRGISVLSGTFFCPLDVAARRPELSLVLVQFICYFAINLKKSWHLGE